MHATGCTNGIGQIACPSWGILYYGTILHAWNRETVQNEIEGKKICMHKRSIFKNDPSKNPKTKTKKNKKK